MKIIQCRKRKDNNILFIRIINLNLRMASLIYKISMKVQKTCLKKTHIAFLIQKNQLISIALYLL